MNFDMLDEIKKAEIKNEIISNTNYIGWLTNFIIQNVCIFNDCETILSLVNITDEYVNNIIKLDYFFEIIFEYAKSKKIESFLSGVTNFLNVKFNGIGLEIGEMMGQGTTIYCRKKDIDDTFIDFNKVISDKKKNEILLNSFANKIQIIYNSGVPLRDIIATFNDAVKEIRQKNRGTTLKREKKES